LAINFEFEFEFEFQFESRRAADFEFA